MLAGKATAKHGPCPQEPPALPGQEGPAELHPPAAPVPGGQKTQPGISNHAVSQTHRLTSEAKSRHWKRVSEFSIIPFTKSEPGQAVLASLAAGREQGWDPETQIPHRSHLQVLAPGVFNFSPGGSHFDQVYFGSLLTA